MAIPVKLPTFSLMQGASAMLIQRRKKLEGPAVADFTLDDATCNECKIWLAPDTKGKLAGYNEKDVPAMKLGIGTLVDTALHSSIIEELGGEKKAMVYLAHIVAKIKSGDMPKGALIVAPILIGGNPLTLFFFFDFLNKEWYFSAHSVEDQHEWVEGRYFLFSDSSSLGA